MRILAHSAARVMLPGLLAQCLVGLSVKPPPPLRTRPAMFLDGITIPLSVLTDHLPHPDLCRTKTFGSSSHYWHWARSLLLESPVRAAMAVLDPGILQVLGWAWQPGTISSSSLPPIVEFWLQVQHLCQQQHG